MGKSLYTWTIFRGYGQFPEGRSPPPTSSSDSPETSSLWASLWDEMTWIATTIFNDISLAWPVGLFWRSPFFSCRWAGKGQLLLGTRKKSMNSPWKTHGIFHLLLPMAGDILPSQKCAPMEKCGVLEQETVVWCCSFQVATHILSLYPPMSSVSWLHPDDIPLENPNTSTIAAFHSPSE